MMDAVFKDCMNAGIFLPLVLIKLGWMMKKS